MKTKRFRISADVPLSVKSAILQAYRPRFPQLFLLSLTWAYDVDSGYQFDPTMTDCTLYALHTGSSTQAFAASLGGRTIRPDGKTLHLTFCTAKGVQPAHAGLFVPSEAKLLPTPITFGTKLMLHPLWQQQPTTVSVE